MSSTVTAAEAASVPAAAASATVKTASVPTATADDNQEVEKITRKLGSSLTTNGKCKVNICTICSNSFSQVAANMHVQGLKKVPSQFVPDK